MKLSDLRPAPGSHKAERRVGRGHGSGRGKTAGRGTKGQKARSGGNIHRAFEGGQTRLVKRLGFVRGLPARAPANEAVAAAGAKLYRDMLQALRGAGLAYLQPGRHLMPAPGPEPPWLAFFPMHGEGPFAALEGRP